MSLLRAQAAALDDTQVSRPAPNSQLLTEQKRACSYFGAGPPHRREPGTWPTMSEVLACEGDTRCPCCSHPAHTRAGFATLTSGASHAQTAP
jgi:hypothetical protein